MVAEVDIIVQRAPVDDGLDLVAFTQSDLPAPHYRKADPRRCPGSKINGLAVDHRKQKDAGRVADVVQRVDGLHVPDLTRRDGRAVEYVRPGSGVLIYYDLGLVAAVAKSERVFLPGPVYPSIITGDKQS